MNAGAAGAQGGLVGVLVVAAVQAVAEHGRIPHRHFSLGALKLYPKSGGKPLVIGHKYDNVVQLLELVFAELHARLGASADFAPFSLDQHALRHAKKGELALAEIESIRVAGFQIAVHKRGKRLAWCRVQMVRMNNSMLVLQQIADRGIVVNPASEVFVPEPTMRIFAATAARSNALPQARLHKG